MKQKTKTTSVRLSKIDTDFLLSSGQKLSPACEYYTRAYRFIHLTTVYELKGKFTVRELMTLLKLQRHMVDGNMFQSDAVGYITAIKQVSRVVPSFSHADVDEQQVIEKITKLTGAQVFVLQEILIIFIRRGLDEEKFREYISIII